MIVRDETISQKSVGVAKRKKKLPVVLYMCVYKGPPRGYIDLYMSTYNGLYYFVLIESRQLQILSFSYQDHSYVYI